MDCDILVLGSGPAASLAARSLAGAGRDVLQLIGTPGKCRPLEVFDPATCREFEDDGLDCLTVGVECRGLLYCWDSPNPQFHDYELFGCAVARALDRGTLHTMLGQAARDAGVRAVDAGQDQAFRDIDVGLARVQDAGIRPRWVIDARGRSCSSPSPISRIHFDRHVAISTPFAAELRRDCLIVEAVANGWWYVPPSADGNTQLVFLSDADLLPVTPDRRRWLTANFASSTLVSKLGPSPSFDVLTGADARASCLTALSHGRWLAAGDNSLALDPLSGSGLATALRGARELTSSLTKFGGAQAYEAWWRSTCDRQNILRQGIYARAAIRFPRSPYWARRR